jgi:hypothetical protein
MSFFKLTHSLYWYLKRSNVTFLAHFWNLFLKCSLRLHFVRLADQSTLKTFYLDILGVLVFCISSVPSSYWRIGYLEISKPSSNTLIIMFVNKFEIFLTVILHQYSIFCVVQSNELKFCMKLGCIWSISLLILVDLFDTQDFSNQTSVVKET